MSSWAREFSTITSIRSGGLGPTLGAISTLLVCTPSDHPPLKQYQGHVSQRCSHGHVMPPPLHHHLAPDRHHARVTAPSKEREREREREIFFECLLGMLVIQPSESCPKSLACMHLCHSGCVAPSVLDIGVLLGSGTHTHTCTLLNSQIQMAKVELQMMCLEWDSTCRT